MDQNASNSNYCILLLRIFNFRERAISNAGTILFPIFIYFFLDLKEKFGTFRKSTSGSVYRDIDSSSNIKMIAKQNEENPKKKSKYNIFANGY